MTAVWFDGGLPHLGARRRTLPCGLDVIVHPDDTSPQVCVSVWYRVGSSDERADRTGFAHLFEHLFKSPQAVGGAHYETLKRAGATDANASTSADRTAYHEVLPSNQLALALWIESGRMGYFADGFDAPRLAAQQQVVRAERRQRYENLPYGAERFAVAAALYPQGHPHRHLTIGRHEDIQAATHAEVLAFWRTWYVPANATLVIGGDVPGERELDALVDRYFGAFPASRRPARRIPATPSMKPSRDQIGDPFATLRRIHRAWIAPPAYSEVGDAELDVLATAWCAPGTGALWRRLVYETELAQRVSAWTSPHRLSGEFHVTVDLRTGADPAAVRAILDEECARSIDERAIARVITRREAGTTWGIIQLQRRVQALQRFALYTGEPDGLARDILRYRAVTPERIAAAIARWLEPSRMIEIETVPQQDRAKGRASAS